MSSKICKKCGVNKPLGEYSRNKAMNDGHINQCKPCVNQRLKGYRKSKVDEYAETREQLIQEVGGIQECCRCGEDKTLDKFADDKYSKLGVKGYCLVCDKVYRDTNRDVVNACKKKWSDNNREQVLKASKNYRDNNKDKRKAYADVYNAQWREANPDKIKEYSKMYHELNRDEKNAKTREYHSLNKDKACEYVKNRYKNDTLFRLTCRVRGRVYNAFSRGGYKKNGFTSMMLGCTYPELMIYLNDNLYGFVYGDDGLDVDHIVPLSSATNEEELIELMHYTNLQLLPSDYNRDIKRDNEWDVEHFEEWLFNKIKEDAA